MLRAIHVLAYAVWKYVYWTLSISQLKFLNQVKIPPCSLSVTVHDSVVCILTCRDLKFASDTADSPSHECHFNYLEGKSGISLTDPYPYHASTFNAHGLGLTAKKPLPLEVNQSHSSFLCSDMFLTLFANNCTMTKRYFNLSEQWM